MFDMPGMERKKSLNDVVTVRSGAASPNIFRKDVSNSSLLRRQQNQKSKLSLAGDASNNKALVSRQDPSRTKKTIDVDDERLKKPNMLTNSYSNV